MEFGCGMVREQMPESASQKLFMERLVFQIRAGAAGLSHTEWCGRTQLHGWVSREFVEVGKILTGTENDRHAHRHCEGHAEKMREARKRLRISGDAW